MGAKARKSSGISRSIGLIRSKLNQDDARRLVTALAFPHLTYCQLVFCGAATSISKNTTIWQRAVNVGMRVVAKAGTRAHNSDLQVRTGIPPIQVKLRQHLATVGFHLVNSPTGGRYGWLQGLFPRGTTRPRGNRMHVPTHRLAMFQRSPVWAVVSSWNALPATFTS